MSAPTIERTRRRRSPMLLLGVATALVAAMLGGFLSPAPAHAVVPDAQELLDTLDETPWANGGVPDWVWRGDTRSPDEVARDGFTPRGDNTNLADHVLDKVRPKDSAYVATGGDQESVESFMRMGTVDANGEAVPQGDFWVYQIAPDDNFLNVQKSFKDALFPDGTVGSFNSELAENLDSGNPDEWITKIVDENEWAARGGIRASSVKTSTKFTHGLDDFGDHAWTPEAPVESPRFERPETEPSGEAANVPAQGACYPAPSGRAATCTPVVDDEDALSDLHKGRFDGDLEDIDFSTDIDRVLADSDTFLTPAPETLDVLADGGDFEELSAKVVDSFGNDLDRLQTVSTDDALLANVGKDLGFGFEDAGEFLPYAGIAATGYALKEDWEGGKWGDLVFDGIAEVVQVAMEADPEFMPFLEPILLVDLFAEQVAQYVWKLAHPAAAAEDWRKHVDNANTQLEAAPKVLVDHWEKERTTALDHIFAEQIDQAMGESLAVRMRSDAAVLKGMRTALVEELRLRASLAAERGDSTVRVRSLSAVYEAEVKLAEATRQALQKRSAQYRAAFPTMATAGAEMVWNLDLTKMTDEFLGEPKISGYIDDVTKQPWEAYYDLTWDDGTSWKDLLEPAVAASQRGLNQVVRDVEKSRTWTIDPIDVQEYVGLFGAAFDEKIGDALSVTGPEATTTRVGVASPQIVAVGEQPTVAWNRSSGASQSVDVPAGKSVRWMVDVPAGLTIGGLPARQDDGSFVTEYVRTGQRVTVSVTAKASTLPLIGRVQYGFPVSANHGYEPNDPVRIRFESVRDVRSLAPARSFVPGNLAGKFQPIKPIELPPVAFGEGDSGSARFALGVNARVETVKGFLIVGLPTDTVLNSTVATGYTRTGPGAPWTEQPALTVPVKPGGSGGWFDFVLDQKVDTRAWGGEWSWKFGIKKRNAALTGLHPMTANGEMKTNLGVTKLDFVQPIDLTSTPRPLANIDSPVTQLDPSGDTAVPFAVQVVDKTITRFTGGTVTLTAPEGTVFDATQTSVGGQKRPSGSGTWQADPDLAMVMKGVSADRRTLTLAPPTLRVVSLARGTQVRWLPLLKPTGGGWSGERTMSARGSITTDVGTGQVFADSRVTSLGTPNVTITQDSVPTLTEKNVTGIDFTFRNSGGQTAVGQTFSMPAFEHAEVSQFASYQVGDGPIIEARAPTNTNPTRWDLSEFTVPASGQAKLRVTILTGAPRWVSGEQRWKMHFEEGSLTDRTTELRYIAELHPNKFVVRCTYDDGTGIEARIRLDKTSDPPGWYIFDAFLDSVKVTKPKAGGMNGTFTLALRRDDAELSWSGTTLLAANVWWRAPEDAGVRLRMYGSAPPTIDFRASAGGKVCAETTTVNPVYG